MASTAVPVAKAAAKAAVQTVSASASPSAATAAAAAAKAVATAASSSAVPMVIDAWAQPFFTSTDMASKLPEAEHLLVKSGAGLHTDSAAMVEAMDKAGIAVSMLSAWCRPGKWIVTNEEVAAIAKAHPGRFYTIASVDLMDPVKAVKELDHAAKHLGCKALRVLPWLWELPPNDKHFYPLYVKCVELGIPFCTQVGHTGPMFPSEFGRPIPYIDEVALKFPDLTIVCGHVGYPWTDEMIALAWKYPNVYIDTSAYLPAYYPPQLMHFMSTYGRKKVLFGTNYPMLDLSKCLEQVKELGLNEKTERAFLYENAARVFKLPSAAKESRL